MPSAGWLVATPRHDHRPPLMSSGLRHGAALPRPHVPPRAFCHSKDPLTRRVSSPVMNRAPRTEWSTAYTGRRVYDDTLHLTEELRGQRKVFHLLVSTYTRPQNRQCHMLPPPIPSLRSCRITRTSRDQSFFLHGDELAEVSQAPQVPRLGLMRGLLGYVFLSLLILRGGLPKIAPGYTSGALSEGLPSCKEALLQYPLVRVARVLASRAERTDFDGHGMPQPLTWVRGLFLLRLSRHRGYHMMAGHPLKVVSCA